MVLFDVVLFNVKYQCNIVKLVYAPVANGAFKTFIGVCDLSLVTYSVLYLPLVIQTDNCHISQMRIEENYCRYAGRIDTWSRIPVII